MHALRPNPITVTPLVPAGPDLAEGLRFFVEELGFTSRLQGNGHAAVRRDRWSLLRVETRIVTGRANAAGASAPLGVGPTARGVHDRADGPGRPAGGRTLGPPRVSHGCPVGGLSPSSTRRPGDSRGRGLRPPPEAEAPPTSAYPLFEFRTARGSRGPVGGAAGKPDRREAGRDFCSTRREISRPRCLPRSRRGGRSASRAGRARGKSYRSPLWKPEPPEILSAIRPKTRPSCRDSTRTNTCSSTRPSAPVPPCRVVRATARPAGSPRTYRSLTRGQVARPCATYGAMARGVPPPPRPRGCPPAGRGGGPAGSVTGPAGRPVPRAGRGRGRIRTPAGCARAVTQKQPRVGIASLRSYGSGPCSRLDGRVVEVILQLLLLPLQRLPQVLHFASGASRSASPARRASSAAGCSSRLLGATVFMFSRRRFCSAVISLDLLLPLLDLPLGVGHARSSCAIALASTSRTACGISPVRR